MGRCVYVCVCVCVRALLMCARVRLTCVDAVVVRGAVAIKGEGGAREGAGVCCWANSELAPPMAPSPVTDVDPSPMENTPEAWRKR